MRPWNLALRFVLELMALAGIAIGVGTGDLPASWALAVASVVVAGAVWGLIGVPGDPSRGKDPAIAVPGHVRLTIELVVFLAGLMGFLSAHQLLPALVMAALIVVHHVADPARGGWLLLQR